MYISIYLSIYLSTYLAIYLSTYRQMDRTAIRLLTGAKRQCPQSVACKAESCLLLSQMEPSLTRPGRTKHRKAMQARGQN